MFKARFRDMARFAVLTALIAGAGSASSVEKSSQPSYYQFFMKEGEATVIHAERKRDKGIASGVLTPIHVGEPIQDFKLPDGFGNTIGLRDYIGKKNIVLTTFRTWW